MLNGDGSENDKNPLCLIGKINNFALFYLQHTFLVHFFAVVVGIA